MPITIPHLNRMSRTTDCSTADRLNILDLNTYEPQKSTHRRMSKSILSPSNHDDSMRLMIGDE